MTHPTPTPSESKTPLKSAHALILNRLVQIQNAPIYCHIHDEAKLAQDTIVSLETELSDVKEKLRDALAQLEAHVQCVQRFGSWLDHWSLAAFKDYSQVYGAWDDVREQAQTNEAAANKAIAACRAILKENEV